MKRLNASLQNALEEMLRRGIPIPQEFQNPALRNPKLGIEKGTEWAKANFPDICTAPFNPSLDRVWKWFDDLRPGVRPRPLVVPLPRGSSKSTSGELNCAKLACSLNRRFVLVVGRTQDSADDHVASIGSWIERLDIPRLVSKYGTAKGWNRQQLRTADNFNIASIGLDVAVRGVKLGSFRPDVILCHEKGTPILHNGEWIPVENHPTAVEITGDGVSVRLTGVPVEEVVTPEHRYWAKTVECKTFSGGKRGVTFTKRIDSIPCWVEAKDLTNHHFIGYPIDMSFEDTPSLGYFLPGGVAERDSKGRIVRTLNNVLDYKVPKEFSDIEWWWLFGLWWGDGHLSGKYQVGITIANTQKFIFDRLGTLLNRYHIKYTVVQKPGCFQVIFSHRVLNAWLRTWRSGNSLKQPPSWVEKTLTKYQRELVRGYIDADGFKDKDGSVRVTSVCLPGLLSLRRILSRFSVPSTIRNGIDGKEDYEIMGVSCRTHKKYDLRFCSHGGEFGATPPLNPRYRFKGVFIEGGFIWSKVVKTSSVGDRTFTPIKTDSGEYLTHFGKSHNCDDFDSLHESPQSVARKIETITQSIIPSGSADCAIIFLQNLIHENSIMSQLVDGRATFLRDREVLPVEPAVKDLIVEEKFDPETKLSRFFIVQGMATWEGQNLKTCEAQINDWGLAAFMREAQNEVESSENGLWSQDNIDANRVTDPDRLPSTYQRIAVGVDPNATEGGDEAGIVVAGVAFNRNTRRMEGYVLEDATATGGPKKWAEAAVSAYHRHKADLIVAEANNGGEMVAITINTVDKSPSVKLVHASRGKLTRAEPVQKLYQDGRVHHAGHFSLLEHELTHYKPLSGMPSPGRLDACLVPGTLITTVLGDIPIEDIRVGDLVLTRKGYRKVKNCGKTSENSKVYKLVVSDDLGTLELIGTENHPVWIYGRGFTPMIDVPLYGIIHTHTTALRDAAHGHVVGFYEAGTSPVYNLEVEDTPEYYANGILVHNCVWTITELMLGTSNTAQSLGEAAKSTMSSGEVYSKMGDIGGSNW